VAQLTIELATGDLLDAGVEALVNPVTTEGVGRSARSDG